MVDVNATYNGEGGSEKQNPAREQGFGQIVIGASFERRSHGAPGSPLMVLPERAHRWG